VADSPQPALKPSPDNAIQKLVLEFAAPLYRYAYRLTGRTADAEDLVQQTFLVAQTRLAQLRDPSRVSAWLHAILRHAWCKLCRRERIHGIALQQLEADFRPTTDPNEGIDRERVQAALNELPAEFRLVVLMYYFEDFSYQEIAGQLDIPIGTVMSRLSRAKQHLRRRLEPESTPSTKVIHVPPEVDSTSPGASFHSLSIG
jgi:RNA polymerase sigma-70 factor (ECF subfamily)